MLLSIRAGSPNFVFNVVTESPSAKEVPLTTIEVEALVEEEVDFFFTI